MNNTLFGVESVSDHKHNNQLECLIQASLLIKFDLHFVHKIILSTIYGSNRYAFHAPERSMQDTIKLITDNLLYDECAIHAWL